MRYAAAMLRRETRVANEEMAILDIVESTGIRKRKLEMHCGILREVYLFGGNMSDELTYN